MRIRRIRGTDTYNANAQPGSKGFNYNLEGSSADKNK